MGNEIIRNIVVVSDLHCGCKFGLCPDRVRLDEGGTYEASRFQRIVHDMWLRFWGEFVPEATNGEPYAVVVNGDSLDGVHHKSTTQISHNTKDQRRIAVELLTPVAEACDGRFYMVRGTEAHVGQSGEDEEEVAMSCGAVHDSDGNASRHDLWMYCGDGLVHFSHHIGTTGTMHYETTAILKELAEAYTEAGRNRTVPPDIIVRSHRHRCAEIRIPTKIGYGISFTTPGWQLKTPFVHRIPGGRATTPQIGGSVIRQAHGGELYTRHRVWTLDRPKPEIVTCEL